MASIVKGKVTTAAGKPLSGVSVTIKSSKKGTSTNENGEFILSVNKEDILVFSYVGYDTKEVKVDGLTTIDITLTESTTALNEIAVIGYGRQTRKNLSSAITTVKSEDLNAGAITDVGQLLQGKVPGLNITASGDPNAPARPAARPAEFSANGDPTELRLLLSLRYRIRVDLGLAEDDYDRLLDELPSGPPASGPPTPAADS